MLKLVEKFKVRVNFYEDKNKEHSIILVIDDPSWLSNEEQRAIQEISCDMYWINENDIEILESWYEFEDVEE